MRASVLILFVLSTCSGLLAQADSELHAPKLLLSAQRLRRLQRDRERQTVRWVNFESRVESIADSPERGFELALYYAITQDANRGKQAVEWALAHRCELRQVALVLDWAADQISESQRKELQSASCGTAQSQDAKASRDALFMHIAKDEDPDEFIKETAPRLISDLQSGDWHDGSQLSAAFEYLYVARSIQHADLRERAPLFFSSLPSALLLSLSPEQVDRPDWQIHIGALALIEIDPNLTASQYLQGWAMEDRQMIQKGEGVAYELLWADPYLPGIGYQNLDPWSYDPQGDLFARTDWNRDACWIHVSNSGIDQKNCPDGWREKTMAFGRLTLVPMSATCVQLPKRRADESVMVSNLRPGQTIYFLLSSTPASGTAGPSGLWKAPSNAEGLVCNTPDTLKVPQAHKSPRK